MAKLMPMNQLISRLTKPLLDLVNGNGLTRGEILQVVFRYLELHCPENQEKYVGGGQPVFAYQVSAKTHLVPVTKRTKPMGDILLDLENCLLPLAHDHDLQWYEILALVDSKINQKCPQAIEPNSRWYYGPKEGLNKFKRNR
jgi:hypothetical protein